MKQFKKDKLEVKIFQSREEMGETAASESAEILRKLLSGKEEINCVFAAAPSQNELLKAQGGTDRTSIYAKQFSIENNLSRIGEWYAYTNANIGDRVRVEWLSETDILITLISQQSV